MEANNDFSGCDLGLSNIPSNLTVIFEKIQKEQNSLSTRVLDLEREMSCLKESVSKNRKIRDQLEEEFTGILRETYFITREIKSSVRCDSLVSGSDSDSISVLETLVSNIEDSKIKREISEVIKDHLIESSKELESDWERIADAVMDQEKDQDSNETDAGGNKEEMSQKLLELKDKEELDDGGKMASDLQKLLSDKARLEQDCDGLKKIIEEREEILSNHEIDYKVEERRLKAQKCKLERAVASVGDVEYRSLEEWGEASCTLILFKASQKHLKFN